MQKGRSLIEMLGVLAIMGLISLTAFQGFEYVLRKHTVENIWKELLVRSADLASRSKTSAAHFGAGFDSTIHGVNWSVVTALDSDNGCPNPGNRYSLVGIQISGLTDDIRDALIKKARMEDDALALTEGVNIQERRKLFCVYYIDHGVVFGNLLKDAAGAGGEARPSQGVDNLIFGFRRTR